MAMTLTVTATGPAAAWADATGLGDGILLDANRHAVVLMLFDGRIPPTRSDVELVHAVSAATGRCAVGLDSDGAGGAGDAAGSGDAADSGGAGGAVDAAVAAIATDDADASVAFDAADSAEQVRGIAEVWRSVLHPDIPVGTLDAAMARTLQLLADGPARPVSPTPGQRRRALLTKQLDRDRSTRARARAEERTRRLGDIPGDIADALESLAATLTAEPGGRGGSAGWPTAADVDLATRDAAEEFARHHRLPEVPDSPTAPEPPRTGNLMDIGVAALTMGAAIGAGRLLSEPLGLLGLPDPVTVAAPIAGGAGLAIGMAWAGRRRRKAQEKNKWIAAHLAKTRRAWERAALAAIRADIGDPPDGWRARHLAHALRKETGT